MPAHPIVKNALGLMLALGSLPAFAQGVLDTVYLDPGAGTGDGKSAARPARTLPAGHAGKPGVAVLYKRGSLVRGEIPAWSGTAEAPMIVGAYGEGPKPVFLKSIALTEPGDWVQEAGNVWRCTRSLKATPAANMVYNDGEYCGAMRWRKADLVRQGDWFMYDTAGKAIRLQDHLFLYSAGNPARVYRSLEYVPVGHHKVFGAAHSHIRVQDIHIANAGTHGFRLDGGTHHITIRRCDISYIGGAPFTHRIGINGLWVRFGNAVEVWDRGKDITVEQCRLWENYDASFVVQGSCGPDCMDNIIFRRNIMWNAGFDHFDQFWGKGVSRVYFENNTCLNAGGGWPYLTEGRPRLSEFLPDSVGWHVFLDSNGLANSTLHIRNNIFHTAAGNRLVRLPVLKPSDWGKVVMDHNLYYQADARDPVAQFGQQVFSGAAFAQYRAATGKESRGLVGDPLFVAPEKGDYRLRAGSPAIDAGGPTTGGFDFSDSVAGFRGKAADIGAFEYTGAPVGLQEAQPPRQVVRKDIEIRDGSLFFRHSAAARASCELIAADGSLRSLPLLGQGPGSWTFDVRAGAMPGQALIRIRTDRGDFFRYAVFPKTSRAR